MNEFKRYVILIICIASCAVAVLMGVMQMIEDKRDEAEFGEVRWDTPKIPVYRGGSVYRAPSSSGGTVTMPRVSSSSSKTLFLHSSGSYSGQGTTTYRGSYASSSAHPVHTFSNGDIHSYGSGGSGGSVGASAVKRTSASSGGYAGVSVSVPSIAMRAPRYVGKSSSVSQTEATAPARRRVISEDGVGGYQSDTDGEYLEGYGWWSEAAEDWLTDPWKGVTKIEGGLTYRYNGTRWDLVEGQANPDSPIGDIPWMLLLLLMGGYVVARKRIVPANG